MACKITYKGKQYNSEAALQLDLLKDRNLLERYNELISIPQDFDNLEAFEDAKKALREILPNMEVKEINGLLDNIVNKGMTVGYFVDKTIYLASNSPMGTAYHEAFHAVFRTYLTDNQISKYLDEARKEFKVPEDLQEFRNQSSAYENLSEQELENLYLEEKMADKFRDYMLNKKPKTKLGRLFSKLKNFILSFFINSKSIKTLFENISTGAFSDAKPVYNVYMQNPAFKIKSFVNNAYNLVLAEDEKQIVTKIAILAAQQGEQELTIKNIQKYFNQIAQQFDPVNWETELSRVPVAKRNATLQRLVSIYNSISSEAIYSIRDNNLVRHPITNNQLQDLRDENAKKMLRSVNRYLNLFNTDTYQEDEDNDTPDEDNVDSIRGEGRLFKGSIYKQSEFFKKYIDTIQGYNDHFRLGIDFTDPQVLDNIDDKHIFTIPSSSIVFATLRRNLAKVSKENVLHYILTNDLPGDSMKIFKERFTQQLLFDLQLAGITLTKDELIEKSTDRVFLQELSWNSKIFNSAISAFNTTKEDFISVKANQDEDKRTDWKVLVSNVTNIEKETLLKWRNNALDSNLTGAQVKEIVRVISDFLEPDTILSAAKKEEDLYGNVYTLEQVVTEIKDNFLTLGITLSPEFIKFNLVHSVTQHYVENKFNEQGNKHSPATALRELEQILPRELIQLYKAKFTVLAPSAETTERTLIRPLEVKKNNILYNLVAAIEKNNLESRYNVIPQLIDSMGIAGGTTAPFAALAYSNSATDEAYSNDSIYSQGKSIFTIGNPNFLTELYNTLNSVEMLGFIGYINDGKFDEAKDVFFKMFGPDSKFGYTQYYTNKLFNSLLTSPYIKQFSETELPVANRARINDLFTNQFLQQLSHAILFDTGVFKGDTNEYSGLNISEKIVHRLALFSAGTSESAKKFQFKYFMPQVDEAKTLNRAVKFPVVLSETGALSKAIVRRALENEYYRITTEVQYFLNNIDNNQIEEDFNLIDGYNYVTKKINGEQFQFLPTFTEQGRFAGFKMLERQYDDYGIYTGSKLVDTNIGLTLQDLPRAFKLFNFAKMDNAQQIAERAMRGVPFSNEFDTALNNFMQVQYNNFINTLLEEDLITKSSISIYYDKNC